MPAGDPARLGLDPGAPPAHATVEEILARSADDFVPRGVTASAHDGGIRVRWQSSGQLSACTPIAGASIFPEVGDEPDAEPAFDYHLGGYDIERVPGTQVVEKFTHPSGYNAWRVTETGASYKYKCVNRAFLVGYEIYRTSFGYVYRDGAVERLSDNQPYRVAYVPISAPGGLVFNDRSSDALVGPLVHNYQVRALYVHEEDITGSSAVRDFGSRLSPGTWIEREHDARQPNSDSPQNLAVSIPTKQAVQGGATLGINLEWDPPASNPSAVTGYVVQRRIVTQTQRALPFADIATLTGNGSTSYSDTGSDVTTTVGRPIYDSAGNYVSSATFGEIAPLRQFSYRVIAVRGTDRSNPSAVASVDSERQLPADGLLTVTNTWRTGATVRVNMTGTDANGNQLGNHAKHHLALAPPREDSENRLLHVGIGRTGWGHNTCKRDPGSSDLTALQLELLGLIPNAAGATTQQIENARQVIDDWLDAGSSRRLADYPAIGGAIKPEDPQYNLYGAFIYPSFGSEGCMHTDDVSVTLTGLRPGTTYTAEALFRLVSEEQYLGGEDDDKVFIPTWDGGFYPGGIWSPAHLVGSVTFTTDR